MKASFKKVYGPPWDYDRLAREPIELPLIYACSFDLPKTFLLIADTVDVSPEQIRHEMELRRGLICKR